MQIKKIIIPVILIILALALYSGYNGSEDVTGVQLLALIILGFGLGVAYTMLWYNIRDRRHTKTPMA
jgi:hypothetical protein